DWFRRIEDDNALKEGASKEVWLPARNRFSNE
ncbi:MAG: hypothetical protein ACI9FN_003721, partial [Saprospiraceae bacterium]